MPATVHTFHKNLFQFLVTPWPKGKWRKCKHRKDRIYGEREARVMRRAEWPVKVIFTSLLSKDAHWLCSSFPGRCQLPWQLLCLPIFCTTAVKRKGRGADGRQKKRECGDKGNLQNSLKLSLWPLLVLCPHCRLKIACKCEVKKGKSGVRKDVLSNSASTGFPLQAHLIVVCSALLHSTGVVFFTN